MDDIDDYNYIIDKFKCGYCGCYYYTDCDCDGYEENQIMIRVYDEMNSSPL